jgi:anti-sigma B factor antagonist
MREQSPRLKVVQDPNATIVELTDRKILDEVNISQIGEQLRALVSMKKGARLVLDFRNVAHMSSSALGMLITVHKRIREQQGQLRMCGISPAIMEVFQITRLSEIFSISASREEALASLQ